MPRDPCRWDWLAGWGWVGRLDARGEVQEGLAGWDHIQCYILPCDLHSYNDTSWAPPRFFLGDAGVPSGQTSTITHTAISTGNWLASWSHYNCMELTPAGR